MLSRILLPSPDAYAITDRQRASANGFLLAPTAQRNFVALQHTLPQYQWVPKSAVKKYRNISPARFGVARGLPAGTYFPLYTLFDPTSTTSTSGSSQTQVVALLQVREHRRSKCYGRLGIKLADDERFQQHDNEFEHGGL